MRSFVSPEIYPAMWFRNLLVYRLTQNVALDAETLEAALAAKPARPCASQELSTLWFRRAVRQGEDARWCTPARAFC